uniref:Uncharacterized protein n=1 Tax=virus sp. ctEfN2 TaxID=2825810 RepID=A0A8S5RMS9_9VIRU|nr:MAG TPA: hypothetical protein [virus sp. ctEfN2]
MFLEHCSIFACRCQSDTKVVSFLSCNAGIEVVS